MPQKSPIEWTDYTSNPIYVTRKDNGKRGWHCDKPSAGCGHCYAEAINKRFGTGLPFIEKNADHLNFHLNENELLEILLLDRKLAKKKEFAKLFLCDMTDLFLKNHTDEMLDKLFAVICLCDRITFQILTKRPERMADYIEQLWEGRSYDVADRIEEIDGEESGYDLVMENLANQLPHVWFGVSVENPKQKKRIDVLRKMPVEKRFISFEPVLQDLGELDLTEIHWAIVGGESGPSARPCDIAWLRSIVTRCQSADVACFVKQLGSVTHKSGGFWSKNEMSFTD